MRAKQMSKMAPALLFGLLGAGAFWDGLYGLGQQLALTAGLAVIAFFVRGATALSRLECAALLLLAGGAAYSLRNPAVAGVAAHGPVILLGWFLAMSLGRRLAHSAVLDRTLAHLWAVVGTLMVFGGLAAMSYTPLHHSGRLASFLGYPIAVGVLGMLGAMGSLLPSREGRWWAPLLLFGNGTAVLLSGSRGVWAVCLLLLLYLAWAAPDLVRRAWWPVAAALPAVLWIGPAVVERNVPAALIAFVSGCLTVLIVERFRENPGWRRWVWGLSGLVWLAALAAAPGWGWFLGRATAIPLTEGSSVERLTFLRDGLALFLQHPWGAGYRAWAALHLQGASYAYYSAEVHSAPLDFSLSFGWPGLAGFLLLLLLMGRGLARGRALSPERLVVLAGLGALALHALIDWDLSYGLFAVPLWIGFGLNTPQTAPVRIPFPALAAAAGVTVAAVIPLAAGNLFTWRAEAALEALALPAAHRHAAMAAMVAPWNDRSYAILGQALSRMGDNEAAIAAFLRARELAPYEPWYAELLAKQLHRSGQFRAAAEAYRELVRLWPWHVPAYETALGAHIDMAMRAELQGDVQLAAALKESGRAILEALARQKAIEPPERPRKAIQVDTPVIRQARAYFLPSGSP